MEQLVQVAERVEHTIGRKLDILSGGGVYFYPYDIGWNHAKNASTIYVLVSVSYWVVFGDVRWSSCTKMSLPSIHR